MKTSELLLALTEIDIFLKIIVVSLRSIRITPVFNIQCNLPRMISQEPHARKQRARECRTHVYSGKPELRTMLGAQRKVKLRASVRLSWSGVQPGSQQFLVSMHSLSKKNKHDW